MSSVPRSTAGLQSHESKSCCSNIFFSVSIALSTTGKFTKNKTYSKNKIDYIVEHTVRLYQQKVLSSALTRLVGWQEGHHHHNRFTALFPGPPGWASARRELLDFMVQGKINRGRHTDHPAGHHSIRTNQCPPPPSPIFFTGQMPFLLLPNQQRPSTEGN